MARHPEIDNDIRRGSKLVNRNVKPKCLQVNIKHSRVAASKLTQSILQHNVDIAFVQ